MRLLTDIYKSPAFWEVDTKRTKILSFPGKFPTRWRIQILRSFSGKPEVDIITRPNSLIANRILRLTKTHGYITLWEFDRGGAFRYLQRQLPRRDFAVTKIAQPIGCFYYPWHAWAGGFFDPWIMPMFHKQMKMGQHIFFIYSPYERMFNGANDPVVAGVPQVVAENKSVEEIDLGKLPKLVLPESIHIKCRSCGRQFVEPAKYKNLIVRCTHCEYPQYCQ